MGCCPQSTGPLLLPKIEIKKNLEKKVREGQ
jgi:hypothetical protein